MTQPSWKYVLSFGLIALGLVTELYPLARLTGAPVSQAEIASASPELASQFQQLGRDYRITIYNTFRLNRVEYDHRRAAWNAVRQMWQNSGGRLEAKRAIVRWLRNSVRNSTAGAIAPLPPLPKLSDVATRSPAPPTAVVQDRAPSRTGLPGAVDAPAATQPIPALLPPRVRASSIPPVRQKGKAVVPSTRQSDIPFQTKAGAVPAAPTQKEKSPKSLTPQAGSSPPRAGQKFSPIRGMILVGPRSRERDFAITPLRPTRSMARPDIPSDGRQTLNRARSTTEPAAPMVADPPAQSILRSPSATHRAAVSPQDVTSPRRHSTGPRLQQSPGNIESLSQNGSATKPSLHPTRPPLTPTVSREDFRTTGRPLQPAPAFESNPSPSASHTPRVARRLIVEPRVEALPARQLTEPTLRRGLQPVEPPGRDDSFAKTLLRSSRKSAGNVVPPDDLARIDRQPIRSRRPAPATAIELPPLAPPDPQAAEEHAQINLIELAAHIAGYNRGLESLENRLLLSKRWTPRQLAQEVAELSSLQGRRQTITLYLRLLRPEVRQTLPKLNTPRTAEGLLRRQIDKTQEIVSRGSFPAVDNENRLDQEILNAASRKLGELARPTEQP